MHQKQNTVFIHVAVLPRLTVLLIGCLNGTDWSRDQLALQAPLLPCTSGVDASERLPVILLFPVAALPM